MSTASVLLVLAALADDQAPVLHLPPSTEASPVSAVVDDNVPCHLALLELSSSVASASPAPGWGSAPGQLAEDNPAEDAAAREEVVLGGGVLGVGAVVVGGGPARSPSRCWARMDDQALRA